MKSALSSTARCLTLCGLCALPACGSNDSNHGSMLDGSAGSGASTGDVPGGEVSGSGIGGASDGAGNGSSVSLNLGGNANGMAAAPSVGTGDPEVCDGVDNDHNGVIDDVDKNADGVCDCLLIATLGVKGNSGQGDVFATWLSARSNNGAADLADQVLTPELLAKYQVIVVQDVHKNHSYDAAEVTALSDWVNKGGGLMSMLGYSKDSTEGRNVNQLIAPFMMSYSEQQILIGNRMTVPVTTWIPHPINTGVMAVGVNNGYPVLGSGTSIATSQGFDVGKAQPVGKGHVFVWCDEWVTYNSEWQGHPDYQVQLFWLNAIKWLTVAGECQVAIPANPPK